MPIAILKFKLPEETEDHNAALLGSKYLGSIQDFDKYLRSCIKYDDYSDFPISNHDKETVHMVITVLRTKLHEICGDF